VRLDQQQLDRNEALSVARQTAAAQRPDIFANVEIDETYVGGHTHRPKGHGRERNKPNDTVLGIIERGGGRLELIPIADAKKSIIQPALEKHVAKSVATIYTDGHPICVYSLRDKFPGKHERIDHNVAYGC
jgi:hypothetical protein